MTYWIFDPYGHSSEFRYSVLGGRNVSLEIAIQMATKVSSFMTSSIMGLCC